MKKLYILAAMAMSLLPVVAQQKYEQGKPGDANYSYLKDYRPLKEYINYGKYPNFKLGIGTTVNDYLNNSVVRGLTNDNFTETVAGNAMKMASCVDGNGNMNFSTVKNYIKAATDAGLNVYGHTLAWHSQQANGWLRSLIKDRAEDLETGDVKVEVAVASKDFRTTQNVGWKASESQYGYTLSFGNTDGLKIHTTKVNNSWEVQFQALTDLGLTSGKSYKMKMMIKGSKSGTMHTKLGDWNSGVNVNIPFTTEWKEVEATYSNIGSSDFLLLQCGEFVGDIYIRTITFLDEKWAKNVSEDRRCIVVKATAKQKEVYDNQFWIVSGNFAAGASYEFTADVRADQAATASTQIHSTPGNYVHYEALGNINFTTDWKTVKVSGKLSKAGGSIAFNLNELAAANNYYFDNLSFKINGVETLKNGDLEGNDVSSFYAKINGGGAKEVTISDGISYLYLPGSTPLSQEEKIEILGGAMEKWIKGMMEACDGKVKAWDVVNEAISGSGNDGEGNYLLQHASGYVPGEATWDVGGDAFYWQDHMGDLEYVRTAIRLARQYGPEDIKLFINDYNLESDWDQNKKVKSLIGWIKKWEADGVTKVDGIGTQMHISYYENSGTQNSKKNAITNMFKLMAESGKLVRVSEMDMGYVNASGTTLATSSLTEAQHKNMADFYEWIIQEYFRIIPADQQWGICQWCPTDAPGSLGGSGWRPGEPVGIWDLNYYRKHVYAGFVKGLGGEVYNAIEQVEAERQISADAIYDIRGNMYPVGTSLQSLPSGIYIIGDRKIKK